MREFFTHEKISDTLYLVRECYAEESGFTLGLVIGEERAAVIDSGLGAVDGLRRYVETLTDKPLICLVTHGHPDHAGGAVLFDKVYMSSLDEEELTWGLTKERRLGDLVEFSGNNAEVLAYAREHCVNCAGFQYENMRGGDAFDLGGVRLEILDMPGHTKGSVAVMNREEGYIFTGDAVCEALAVTGYEKKCMEESHQALEKLVEAAEEAGVTELYAAHYAKPVPLQMAVDLRDACGEVLEGKTEQDERTHFLFAELNDPDIILKKHVKNHVSVTYNAAPYSRA